MPPSPKQSRKKLPKQKSRLWFLFVGISVTAFLLLLAQITVRKRYWDLVDIAMTGKSSDLDKKAYYVGLISYGLFILQFGTPNPSLVALVAAV